MRSPPFPVNILPYGSVGEALMVRGLQSPGSLSFRSFSLHYAPLVGHGMEREARYTVRQDMREG